jgi:hypothetical protein
MDIDFFTNFDIILFGVKDLRRNLLLYEDSNEKNKE